MDEYPIFNFPCERCGADFIFRVTAPEIEEIHYTCFRCGAPFTINKEQIKPHHVIFRELL